MGRPRSEARVAAKEAGLRYFDGAACKNCGTVEKYAANGSCVRCAKALAKAQRKARKERTGFALETVRGPECRRCGTSERYASNSQCVKCKRESQARRRAAKKVNDEK